MKLIFVNRYFYPDTCATAQLLSSLAFSLVERGWEVHVVTNRRRYDTNGSSLPSKEFVRGVRVHRIWTSSFGRARLLGRAADYLTFYGSAGCRLWRITRQPDIIVAKTDPPMISVMAAGVTRMRKAKLVNWLQDLFPEVAQVLKVPGVDGTVARLLRYVRDESLRIADNNVVLGERMREKVKSAGIPSARICTIANWECGQVIMPVAKDKNRLRREWNLEDKFVVGYSGNMGRAHEFDTILRAANILSAQDNIVFVWIGDGAQRQWLERQASVWGLTNFVFKPYQSREHLYESLSLPDVHLISLLPALEGLIVPSKFCGIAAAGRPALFIGDSDGEIAVMLRKHGCGYSVRPGDYEALAGRITELSVNADKCRLLGLRARQIFEAKYEQHIALNRWEKLLQQSARVSVRRHQYGLKGGSADSHIDTRSRDRALALT